MTPTSFTHHGYVLKQLLRNQSKLIDRDFAKNIGVTKQNLYLIYGREHLPGEMIEKICKALHVTREVFDQQYVPQNIYDSAMHLIESQQQTIASQQQSISSILGKK